MVAVHLTITLCRLKLAQVTAKHCLSCYQYARASFLPNLIFLKEYMYLPIIMSETTFATQKELWLNVQVPIYV